jgi:predicted nucleic acid-binding protein
MDRFIGGEFSVVISQQVLEELVRTIKEKLPAALPALRKLLDSVSLEIVKDPDDGVIAGWAEIVHHDDAAILAAAVAAQLDYLVTGDKHFFEDPSIIEKSKLCIVTPDRFLAYIDSGNS